MAKVKNKNENPESFTITVTEKDGSKSVSKHITADIVKSHQEVSNNKNLAISMEDFKFGNKVHVFSDLDLLSTKKSAKEFLDETIPKLPAKIGHFKAILPIDEESNFNGEAFYNGILLEFNKMVPENNYYITAKSLP